MPSAAVVIGALRVRIIHFGWNTAWWAGETCDVGHLVTKMIEHTSLLLEHWISASLKAIQSRMLGRFKPRIRDSVGVHTWLKSLEHRNEPALSETVYNVSVRATRCRFCDILRWFILQHGSFWQTLTAGSRSLLSPMSYDVWPFPLTNLAL